MTTTTEAKATENLLPQSEAEWKEMLEKFTANARTFRDFSQLTPESMEVIYMVAYNHYNAGKYTEAEKVFRLLAMLDHFNRKYWKGLAAAREALKQYEPALQAYGYLGLTDMHDPVPPFQAARCFAALGKPAEAESSLRAAVANSTGKTEHAKLHQQAKALLDALHQARATTPNAAKS